MRALSRLSAIYCVIKCTYSWSAMCCEHSQCSVRERLTLVNYISFAFFCSRFQQFDNFIEHVETRANPTQMESSFDDARYRWPETRVHTIYDCATRWRTKMYLSLVHIMQSTHIVPSLSSFRNLLHSLSLSDVKCMPNTFLYTICVNFVNEWLKYETFFLPNDLYL